MLFCKQTLCVAQQNTIDDKKLFLYYVKVNHYGEDRTMFEKYLRTIKAREFNINKNDEFGYSKFYSESKTEYAKDLETLDFSIRFEKTKLVEVGAYNFDTKSFPLRTGYADLLNENEKDFFGELFRLNPYSQGLPGLRTSIFNSSPLELKMSEAVANSFIQSRKSPNGNVNRKVLVKAEYSIMNKNSTFSKLGMYNIAFLTIYIHKISIWDGPKLLNTIYPYEDYYDKINGIKIKEGALKIFYNDKWNEINKSDSASSASYFRIINYKNGKIENPVTDYYINGKKQMEGNFSVYGNMRIGQTTWFYDNGQISSQAFYTNGEMNGKYVAWYANGSKQEEVYYVNGVKQGCDYVWDERGRCLKKSILGGWTYAEAPMNYFDNYINGATEQQSEKCPCVELNPKAVKGKENNSDAIRDVSPSDIKSNYIGHYNSSYPGGEYKFAPGGIFYKSNLAEVKSATFDLDGIGLKNTSNDLSFRGSQKTNRNLGAKLVVAGFKPVNGNYKYTASFFTTYEGQEYDKKENMTREKDEDPLYPFHIYIAYNIPSLKAGATNSHTFYINFLFKDQNSNAIIQGFFKYTLTP
ncbi:MAG: uncharacterized protein JWQ09_248 [Segetibacter sp.]|nr:uncharacterized protein [Segetibacter sp.]